MSTDVRQLVVEYVQAVGQGRFDRFEELLHPDVEFGGATAVELQGAPPVAEGFRRLGPIIVRNDIKQLIVEADQAFVLCGAAMQKERSEPAEGRLGKGDRLERGHYGAHADTAVVAMARPSARGRRLA